MTTSHTARFSPAFIFFALLSSRTSPARRHSSILIGPKKSELKVGESSAFFLYVKSSKLENNSQGVAHDESTAQHSRMEENIQTWGEQMSNNIQVLETGEKYQNYSQGDNSLVVVVSPILFLWRGLVAPLCHWNFHNKVSLRRKSALRSGVVNQVMMPSSAQLHQKKMHDLQNHASSSMLSQYNHIPQCPSLVPGMVSYPYNPVNVSGFPYTSSRLMDEWELVHLNQLKRFSTVILIQGLLIASIVQKSGSCGYQLVQAICVVVGHFHHLNSKLTHGSSHFG
ncbi:hypothetical protein L1049_012903 [Liquidambar formosana]|uniref:Uncharacterized protein n=1 Tax=Liquidambar formosana TaxID=63359 RepID=A0AAP0RK99_LIQFO